MSDLEKLQEIISEIDGLLGGNITSKAAEFQAWHTKAERFLIKRFGQDSFEHQQLKNTEFRPGVYMSTQEVVFACKRGLNATKLTFESYLREMLESTTITVNEQYQPSFDKVFVVHGHDGELKQAVARIIEKQGIEAIILSERANKGRTIIEKFEDYSDVGGAICLFTADDLGRAKAQSSDQSRARQNVVLETGYFMGKLGRDHVVLLADKGIEMPSDLSGVVYTDTTKWEIDLLKELKAIGYTVDFNKLF